MTNRPKLLPCPFCGGTAAVHEYLGSTYNVSCLECACQIRSFYSVERAAKEWNKRVYPEEFALVSTGNVALHAGKIESKSDIIEWS